MGKQWKQCQTLFFWATKSLQRVIQFSSVQFSSVQSLSRVQLFATPWIAARQASLSITNSQSSFKLTSIESVMPSSHLILCRPLLLLPSISPSIRVFSNEPTLRMRWPKYWSFSFSIIPSKDGQNFLPHPLTSRKGWEVASDEALYRVLNKIWWALGWWTCSHIRRVMHANIQEISSEYSLEGLMLKLDGSCYARDPTDLTLCASSSTCSSVSYIISLEQTGKWKEMLSWALWAILGDDLTWGGVWGTLIVSMLVWSTGDS